MREELRVLVVSDDPLSRGGLAALVGAEGFLVVGPFASIDASRHGLLPPAPDVAAWDVGSERNLERMHDLDAIPVLALVDEESSAAEALAQSARGVLFRDAPAPRLASALRAIVHGNIVLDESLTSLLRPRSTAGAPAEPLTAREAEVLQLMSLGLSNKEIAGRLGMSEHTAKFHVNGILSKLGAGSRTEAVVRAARTGLLIL